jgi:hypothetical protein
MVLPPNVSVGQACVPDFALQLGDVRRFGTLVLRGSVEVAEKVDGPLVASAFEGDQRVRPGEVKLLRIGNA